jgi:hypothetical protein
MGSATTTRPPPQAVFHVDKDVLATEPTDVLAPRPRLAENAPGAREMQNRVLFERRCAVDVYRCAFDCFKNVDIDASLLDQERYDEASVLSEGMFGFRLSKDQVTPVLRPKRCNMRN